MNGINLYDKYYLNDEQILNIILQDGIIAFDTSALLYLYYYSEAAKNQIFTNAFSVVEGRLWLPAQVYFEFLKNRRKVSEKPQETYRALLNDAAKNGGPVPKIFALSKEIQSRQIDGIKNQLKTLKENTSNSTKHPFVDASIFNEFDQALEVLENAVAVFIEKTDIFKSTISKDINGKIEELQSAPDDTLNYIESHFRIGREFSFEEMLNICREGKYRYGEQIPPGYEDKADKEGMRKYGDLFIWKQILEYAETTKKDILFISNDVKKDWHDNEYDAPRIELLKEFNSITGKSFWSCTMSKFLYILNQADVQEQKIDEKVIEEVGSVSESADINEEDALLYTETVKKWLRTESEYIIQEMLPLNQEWRIFGKVYVYKAITYQREEGIIVLNVVNKLNYANVLHALRNAVAIKKYYDKFGKKYRYRQLIVLNSLMAAEAFEKLLALHPKLTKFFRSQNIENTLLYLDLGQLIYIDSNHPMG